MGKRLINVDEVEEIVPVLVGNNNTIYLLGSDAGIHHVTEELPSNLEAKVREYKP